MIFQGVIDRCVCVYVGKGGLVPDSGTECFVMQNSLPVIPLWSPSLKSSRLFLSPHGSHVPFYIMSMPVQKNWNLLAEYKAQEISKCMEDECCSNDRILRRDKNAEFRDCRQRVFVFRACRIS